MLTLGALYMLCAFMVGVLAGLCFALAIIWPPIDGLVKLFNHTPKG